MFRNFLIVSTMLCIVSCKSPEARRPIKTSSGSFISESVERNKKLIEEEEGIIEALMEQDSTKKYIASESGFWYYYNVQDTLSTNKLPEFGDNVIFTYNIKHLNGDTILSETDTGIQNYKVDQTNQALISGIRDGIKLMKEGETITFLFPSHKAYGYYGIENKLGTNIPVQSTVTLKSINSTVNN